MNAGGDDVSIAAPAAEPSMVGLVRPVEARTSITSSDMHHPILGILPAAEQTSTQPVSGELSCSCKTGGFAEM